MRKVLLRIATARMTKLWMMAFLAIFHWVLPQPVLAEVDENIAVQLMNESGFTDALSAVSREYSQRISSSVMDAPDPALGTAVARAVDAEFSGSLSEATISVFRKGMDATTVADIRKWNATPLGNRLLRTEQGFAAYAYTSLMDRQLPMLKLDNGERLKVLENIVDASRIENILLESSMGFALAVTRAGDLANGNVRTPLSNNRASEVQLDFNARVLGKYFAVLLPQYAALYSEFSTEELRQYADHLATPAATKWNTLKQFAVRGWLKARNDDLESRLADIAKLPASR